MSNSLAAGFQLSPQQKRLWAHAADGSIFNAVISVLVQGSLDVERLKQAMQVVIARHEILRTTFERQSGMKIPVQVVNEHLAPAWNQIDLGAVNSEERQARLQAIVASETQHAFNLAKGPILRATVIALAENEHTLVIALPSLCADAASLNNIVREISQAYAGASPDDDVFQYADYAGFANELLQDETDEDAISAKKYWQELQSQQVPELRLPFEAKPSEVRGFRFNTIELHMQDDLVSVSDPEEFFAACWHTFLWRVAGQSTITVGRISDGRNHDELNRAMGLFARSLPLLYEFEGSRAFSAVLEDLRTNWSTAYQRQDYFPLEGTDTHSPVAFVVEEAPATFSAGTVSFSVLQCNTGTEPFHIGLRFVRSAASGSLRLCYDPQYFSREAVARIAKQFPTLARHAASNLECAIADLEILIEEERRQVLVDFNSTTADCPRDKSVHQLFEETAARVPERPALRFGETCLSYAELNSRANRLSHLLRRNGVKSNVAVPLCLDRSAEMIVALLAILKAGGAYVPLVPDNPKARLAQQLSDTNSPVLITEQKFLANLPAFAGQVICLDRDKDPLANESVANLDRVNQPSDTVYVIYTSGSTGIPKGVEVTHSNLINYAWFMAQKLNPAAQPLNFATVSTLAADLGNTAIFPALISGGCLHVISYETALAANRFGEYVEQHPIDVLKITPSHLASLLAAAEGSSVLPRKYLIIGGEAASWDLVSRVQQSGTCKVINHYGPTEATVGCCTFAVEENDVQAWAPATVPIGRPIANEQVYILDQKMGPVPVGVAGELCIGGAGIAKGYLNQPQQTAERFINDPFSIEPGARLYRTGDLARLLPDGNIEFLGRIDQQVKIRGFRVEPAELESVLKKHAAVQQAVVIARPDKSGDKRLVAYVIANNKSAQTSAELRAYLQERLPEYMVPSAVICLDALPLTRNGKVDTAALPSPDEIVVEHAATAPRNPIEQELAEIWRQVLARDQIGVDDNFFDLGGHSLLATQVIARIRSAFHVQLPLRSLFDTPTVAGLAQQIATMPQSSEDEEVARLLQELEGLSDDEAERLLGQEVRKAAEGSGND